MISPFADRSSSLADVQPRPAKVLSSTSVTKRRVAQIIDHLQAFVYGHPAAVDVLAGLAARYRAQMPPPLGSGRSDDTLASSSQLEKDEAVLRVIAFAKVYAAPRVVPLLAADALTQQIVAEEGRQRVTDLLPHLGPKEVAAMVALAARLAKNE